MTSTEVIGQRVIYSRAVAHKWMQSANDIEHICRVTSRNFDHVKHERPVKGNLFIA